MSPVRKDFWTGSQGQRAQEHLERQAPRDLGQGLRSGTGPEHEGLWDLGFRVLVCTADVLRVCCGCPLPQTKKQTKPIPVIFDIALLQSKLCGPGKVRDTARAPAPTVVSESPSRTPPFCQRSKLLQLSPFVTSSPMAARRKIHCTCGVETSRG